MTSSARLVGSKVDASYRIVITCDFEADLSDKTLDEEFPLDDVPLTGDWALHVKGSDDSLCIDLVHMGAPLGCFGSCVTSRYELFWADRGVLKLVDRYGWRSGRVPEASEGGTVHMCFSCLDSLDRLLNKNGAAANFNVHRHQQYRFVFELRQACLAVEHDSVGAGMRADRIGDSTFEPSPHNFRLFFPKPGKDGASLWVNADLLSSTCPYFKDLLASDFAEAAPRRAKCLRPSGEQPLQPEPTEEKDFEDSDDETDDFRFAKVPPKHEEPPDDLSYREITITQTAFSTYHALIVFLQTGFVRFAPLKSACKPSNTAGIDTLRELLDNAHHKHSDRPLPVSPKSLYRLVDLLGIPDDTGLATLSLNAFANSLTYEGAAHELFSGTATCFEPLRKVVIAYVVAHWNEVRVTASWKEYAARMKAGDLPGTEGIMMELSEARDEAE
ncbi:hypothetical protein JCM10207_009158 [Rhodosporidiobolus poonsookiae]